MLRLTLEKVGRQDAQSQERILDRIQKIMTDQKGSDAVKSENAQLRQQMAHYQDMLQ